MESRIHLYHRQVYAKLAKDARKLEVLLQEKDPSLRQVSIMRRLVRRLLRYIKRLASWRLNWRRQLSSGLVSLLLGLTSANGQTSCFVEVANSPLDSITMDLANNSSMSIVPTFVDLDCDEDQDVFVNSSTGLRYFKNEGDEFSPQFEEVVGPNFPLNGLPNPDNRPPAFGDFDKDGLLDLLLSVSGEILFYRNIGPKEDPGFQLIDTLPPPALGVYRLGDMDGDQDLDLVMSVDTFFLGGLQYWENTSIDSTLPPSFVQATGMNNPFSGDIFPNPIAPAIADLCLDDLNCDGNLDLFVGLKDGTIRTYMNVPPSEMGCTSNPCFEEKIGSDNPFDGLDLGDRAAPFFADLDGDDDLDMFVGVRNNMNRYFENQCDCGPVIPTMREWGLITLFLSLFIVYVTAIKEKAYKLTLRTTTRTKQS